MLTGTVRVVAGVLVLAVSGLMGGSFGPQGRPTGDTVAVPVPGRPARPSEGADGGTPPSASPPVGVVLIQGSPARVDAPGRRRTVVGSPAVITGTTNGIPVTVLSAYRDAVAVLNATEPGCHIPVELLAGIGKVESGHARGGRVTADGTALSPILGPVLDGVGTAAIADTDGGALDGDPVWDRAVGPMQFIPSTWRRWASDGNGDGRADPENIFDASLASARYLCAGGRDLSTSAGIDSAILSYNNSTHYLQLVLAWMNDYSGAVLEVADVTGPSGGSAGQGGGGSPRSGPPAAPPPGSTAPTTVVTTTTVLVPGPPTTTAVTPAPPGTVPPPTGTPPRPTPPPPAVAVDPVTGLLCGVQDVVGTGLGLLGGLLGGGAPSTQPDPGCPSTGIASTGTGPKG
jgi:hypothetical protein